MTLDELIESGKALVTADELAAVDGFPSRSTIHEAIRAGQLPSMRIGRRVYIVVPRLLRDLGVDPPTCDDPAGEAGPVAEHSSMGADERGSYLSG